MRSSPRIATRVLLTIACVMSVATYADSQTASATFPGRNGRIAFRRFLNEEQTWGAVFTINPDGTDERQITFPPQGYVDRNPDVSPDGRRIAFEREGVDCGPDCGYDEIFVVDVDGSNLTQLTHNRAGCHLRARRRLQRLTGVVTRRATDRLPAGRPDPSSTT